MTQHPGVIPDGGSPGANDGFRGGERILIIQSAPPDAGTVSAVLLSHAAAAGNTVVQATSLREGLELLRVHTIDVVVLDPVLPDADPDTALQRVQAANPSLPLLLAVPASLEEFARESVRAGVQEYLVQETLTLRGLDKALWATRYRKSSDGHLHVFTRTVEQSPMSIVITNTDGNIEYVNPRFTAVTGYSADEVLGQNPRVLKSGLMDPQVYVSMWRTLSTGGEWRGELQNRKKNGELFWEYASISAIRNHRGVVTHYLAVKEDITARKILERQVSRSERMDGIAHALGSIAHSFNDLLNNVLGFASLIRKNAGDRDKTVRYLATIERSVHRGAELVQRLMAFSTSGGEMAEILDLRPLLEEAVRRVKERFPPRLLLHTNYEQNLPRLSGERGALIQCFANLLENACEAMQEAPSADPVLSIDARTLAHQGEGSTRAVAVSVCDTGSGISRELQDTIFEPFFTTKHDRDNRGLGLAVVHTIIRRHRGTISVQSDPGRGTTVTIFLPARAADSGEPASEDEARLRGERELILLVDDEPSMLSFGSEVLEEHNYRVLTARDGNEALELYRRHAADISLVVLDLLMPGMDGGQTYLEMKKINGNLRAFFCTGFTSDSVITSLLAEEHLRALRKPFRVDDFLATVRDVLRVA